MPFINQRRSSDLETDPHLDSPEFECKILTDFAELQELAPAWHELWQSHPQPEVFQSFTWAQAWWQAFGQDFQLRTAVVYHGGQLVLILPLVQQRGTLRFLGVPQSDYSDIVCSYPFPEQPLAVALQTILQAVPRSKGCILENVRRDSHLAQACGRLPRHLRSLLRIQVVDICPTIVLTGNRYQVLDHLLASKHLRRRLRKLQKCGNVAFRHLQGREEIRQQLAAFFRCHRRRCALLAKTSCFEDPGMRRMMEILAEQLDPLQELRFGVLELDGHPLAWSLGFLVRGKYAYYQQTFDVDAEHYAPGELLLYHLLAYARAEVEREIDFLRGDEFFKRRFATQTNEILAIYLEPPGLRGRVHRLARSLSSRSWSFQHRIVAFVRMRQNIFQVFRGIWVWKRTLLRRLQWARRTGQLPTYLAAWGLEYLQHALWSSEVSTRFESRRDLPLELECAASDPNISIAVGRISDLADIALEHPEIPFPGFHEYRGRLKNGDRVYLIRNQGDVALVAWIRVEAANSGRPAESGDKTAVTMYECWPLNNPGPGCTCLLSQLAVEASQKHSDLLVHCPEVPLPSRKVLDRQGYTPRARTVFHKVLGLIGIRRKHKDLAALPRQEASQNYVCPKLRKGHDADSGFAGRG